MDNYRFTIGGTHRMRNPMGYKRVLNHSMREDGVKYMEWQQYVRACFYDRTGISRIQGPRFDAPLQGPRFDAPLEIPQGKSAYMDILIQWADETHADADNVWKGLADSLFVDDKHLMGSFHYTHVRGLGSVHVSIDFLEQIDPPIALLDPSLLHIRGPSTLPDRGLSGDKTEG